MELRLPRGMRDFPPEEKILRDEVCNTLVGIFENYGFSPLETPVAERWEILSAKYAGGAEILQETFKLTDQGGRTLGLRYDLTVPLARFIGMNPTIKRPFKRYQLGPVFRDGPIRQGRTRQFIQCDVDTVGTSSMLADAECINLALDAFEQLGFHVVVKLNNRKVLYELIKVFKQMEEIRDAELPVSDDDIILSLDKLEKAGREGVIEELEEKGLKKVYAQSLLNILERMKGENHDETLKKMRALSSDYETPGAGLRELDSVMGYIANKKRVAIVPSLARGLSYYTGTIFEVFSVDPPFDSSIAAGGRYDRLIGDLLGSDEAYPAVGISFGLEPILEAIKMQRSASEQTSKKCVTDVYVVPIKTVQQSLLIAQQLRQSGIDTDMDLVGRGISDNLRYANAYNIPYALIVGPDEVAQGKVKLRDMTTGAEELLTVEQVIERVRRIGR